MPSRKESRVGTAVGFLSGLLACMNALRDASVTWPPDAAWEQMSHPHRLEFAGGAALIIATLVITVVRSRAQAE
jgi:hypothetical protein